ncbi:hypothetical protein [Leptolyngbya sp. FACHB-711]|jgi:hypothetical protein|uniref:hypothetical protein n=1 Tax=unclassified Leptolyngbya TaxID=2650499 RepID=UPI0016848510|nr:hypothetical protein [Leptolyngbya sp. FACHB-711]MBD1853656.1 hypothetical protein [Cyanobacteria bacterium FACHB-502]MBD2026455.1 hypothetical protein [Leptolyngbya sp. FACHB-711]
MQLSHPWQSGLAVTLATIAASTVALPLSIAKSDAASSEGYLIAQRFPDSWRTPMVAVGTQIPVRYDKSEKIVLTPEETVPVTLTVARDITSTRGSVLIPAGSQIKGELKPASGGTQFVAEEITLFEDAEPVAINATSDVITRTETVSRRTNPNIFRGAAIGAAAGAVLGEIFGSIDFLEILGGAGVGVLGEVLLRDRREVEVVVVEPDTDLALTLQSNFERNSSQALR